MIARLFALKLFAAILLTSCATSADPRALENDCGIVAAEAYSRLKSAASWTRVMAFRAIWRKNGHQMQMINHVITAYQYTPDSHILIFDRSGTAELDTTSHEPKAIAEAIQEFTGDLVIMEIRFLSP
jgi:hypothetical protein